MLSLLKKIIKHLYFSFFRNIYKTDYPRHALVSYIVSPLYRKEDFHHQNVMEMLYCCQAIRDLGFNVDVTDYTYEGHIDYSKYSLIFGFGFPYGKSFHDPKCKAVRIAYNTGAMNLFDQMKRVKYLYERRGVKLLPRREYYAPFLQETIAVSDGVLITGNEWSRKTAEPYNIQTYSIPIPVYLDIIPKPDIAQKNFTVTRKHFLWFGSHGAIHKGLDLLLDAFAALPDLHLHVCGPVVKEEDFVHEYKHELYDLPNIHYHGFVPIVSEQYRRLLQETSFVILPSCSEGGGGSAVTCMAGGLIPVVTEAASINTQDFGVLLTSDRVESIQQIVRDISNSDEEKLRICSRKTIEYTQNNHSKENYYRHIHKAILEIIESRQQWTGDC